MPQEMTSTFESRTQGQDPVMDPSFLKAHQLHMYQMRCPKCRKLYSVQGEQMRSASLPLKFECLVPTCKTRYYAELTNAEIIDGVKTWEIEVPPAKEPATPPQPERPVITVRTAIEKAPVTAEMKCPKCGTRNAISAAECKTCGIVFAKAKSLFRQEKPENEGITGEISLAGRRELAELWENVMANYEDQERHDRFVRACYEAHCLPYASHKYSRILSASPNEEIAKAMRKRIIALASHKFETRGEKPSFKIRMPGLNSLVLILGSTTMAMGLMLPGFQNLTGLGLSAVLLAIGVRFFIRRQQF